MPFRRAAGVRAVTASAGEIWGRRSSPHLFLLVGRTERQSRPCAIRTRRKKSLKKCATGPRSLPTPRESHPTGAAPRQGASHDHHLLPAAQRSGASCRSQRPRVRVRVRRIPPPMPNYLPTPVTQPAAPRTSNALRSGVIALGAVVAVGAGALL